MMYRMDCLAKKDRIQPDCQIFLWRRGEGNGGEIHFLMSASCGRHDNHACHGKNYSPAILQLYLDDFPVVLIDKEDEGHPSTFGKN